MCIKVFPILFCGVSQVALAYTKDQDAKLRGLHEDQVGHVVLDEANRMLEQEAARAEQGSIQQPHVAKAFLKPFVAFHGNTVACTWCHGNPVPQGLLERGLCLLEQAKQPTKEP